MSIIDYLRSFNRKERYYLVKQLLNNAFELDKTEFGKILDVINNEGYFPKGYFPKDYFAGMDYHLDWIYASLELAKHVTSDPHAINDECIVGTIEDIDFIIAFEFNDVTHIILIEAKGDAYFSNNQMKKKTERLDKIFENKGETVKWYLLLCSPNKPTKKLEAMEHHRCKEGYLKLNMGKDLKKVQRCDSDKKASKTGEYWHVI